jgi:predicted acetyltransferase
MNEIVKILMEEQDRIKGQVNLRWRKNVTLWMNVDGEIIY